MKVEENTVYDASVGVHKQVSKQIGGGWEPAVNHFCLPKTESQLGQYHEKNAVSFSN